MATKTTKTTKTAAAAKKAPAAKKPAAKARGKVAPPALGEALSAAASRAYANDHVRTAGKVAIGAVVGVVLTKTVFA